MRLAKREITDPEVLENILKSCQVVRIGAVDEEGIFIVPMNYGYEIHKENGTQKLSLYLHGAKEGRKAAIFETNPQVAIELDDTCEVITGTYTCSYSCAYRSIMGQGKIVALKDAQEKIYGLNKIMQHMAPQAELSYLPEMVERVAVWRIDVDSFTGKERKRQKKETPQKG